MKPHQEINRDAEKEAVFGIVPIPSGQKKYGFTDAFLILSGYCIATWSYTQGAYLATLVGFQQLLIGAFFAAILMLVIYQLPVILSVRYGIDIWIWLRAVFGHWGVKMITILIIAINFPWYAVCADLFASSMMNLLGLLGLSVPSGCYLPLALLCVIAGTLLAYRGVRAITWTTRLLVPLLLAIGVMVIIVALRAVPFDAIWNYRPVDTGYSDTHIPYLISIEANFAFVITLVGGMAAIPRMAKTERGGFWAGVLGQGLSGSFFVVVGAVMSIATQYVTGILSEDPTSMLAVLSTPIMACSSLMLVAFANIGTQAVGSYTYGVMLKSSFRKLDYRLLIFILCAYVALLCVWGQITTYFGSFLTIGACVYAPLAALLFSDFFIVRRQKLSLRDVFGLSGYRGFPKFNWVGLFCCAAGVAMSLLVYNPITGTVHIRFLFTLTPTGCAFLGTCILYSVLSCLPPIRRYILPANHERMGLAVLEKKHKHDTV
ncbi:MAG: cytosine permease [Oscillospiraceae bacterium]|nr:cytosine permease [Oscillospiraceae bacterium]